MTALLCAAVVPLVLEQCMCSCSSISSTCAAVAVPAVQQELRRANSNTLSSVNAIKRCYLASWFRARCSLSQYCCHVTSTLTANITGVPKMEHQPRYDYPSSVSLCSATTHGASSVYAHLLLLLLWLLKSSLRFFFQFLSCCKYRQCCDLL
jgi:hypothetical protein